MDVGIEIDNHEGLTEELLPVPRSLSNDQTEAAIESATGEAQGILRYSLLGSLGGRPIYPLDWQSIRNMFVSLKPAEASRLGLESTEGHSRQESSTFNFDHVAASYGDVEASIGFISSALLFPLSFLAQSEAAASDSTVVVDEPQIVSVVSNPTSTA